MKNISVLAALLLTACATGDGLGSYYGASDDAPTADGISQEGEVGNVGGDVVTITGSNFGGDTGAITVVFGSLNAEIISVSESKLTVRVPQGPVQGGEVEVRIGTRGGRTTVPGGYTYDVGDMLEFQAGYVLVQNAWESCLMGMGVDNEQTDCASSASVGYTGVSAQATFLEDGVLFPNMHSMYISWGGGSDIAGEWKLQVPGQNANAFDAENAYEDLLRDDIRGLRLVNRSFDMAESVPNDEWCTDLNNLASYRYRGGFEGDEYYAPYELGGEDLGLSLLDESDDLDCLESNGSRLTHRPDLNFCMTQEADNPQTNMFQADWTVGAPYFAGVAPDGDGTSLNSFAAADLRLDVPQLGIEQNLRVPPPVKFYATDGWDNPYAGQGLDDSYFAYFGLDSCEDTNGNGEFDLLDSGLTMEWKPYGGSLSDVVDGADGESFVKARRTQVKLSLLLFDVGWLGGIGTPVRASITVPDNHNYDPETGRSSIEVPAWLLYQFPSASGSWGSVAGTGRQAFYNWGNSTSGNYGYLIMTIDRITEYTVDAPGLKGDLVFAYATGDQTFLLWDNPLEEATSCRDCVDNDGDGWADSVDPDCWGGDEEDTSTYGENSCNDGIDNDGDGVIDSDDDDCESGRDAESLECGDGEDNDGDGWVDQDDPDCTTGVNEDNSSFGRYTCNDLEDNDADGWVDQEDPACTDATAAEADGFTDVECNDGIDNDGHGDIDGEDLMCIMEGATFEVEEKELTSECANGEDDDEDGYTDANDPDCEFSPWGFERRTYRDPETFEGINQCYNGLDDDGDGAIDALDPGCLNAEGVADGYLDDESAADPEGGDDTGETGDTGESGDTGEPSDTGGSEDTGGTP